jgi:hypothetical protein
MARAEAIQRIRAQRLIEGTPQEITKYLSTLPGDKRLTLIIPGEEIEAIESAEQVKAQPPDPGMTFRQIFASSQTGFDQTGMTDDELSDFLEDEVKAYRAERQAKEQANA